MNGRLPLRVTLVATTVVLAALALVVVGVASTAFLRGFLVDQVDAQLADVARAISGRPDGPGPGRDPRPPQPGAADNVVLLGLSADGAVVGTTGTGTNGPVVPAWTPTEVSALGNRPQTLPAADSSTQWRAVAATDGSASVVVAQDLAAVEATVRRLMGVELVVGAIVIAMLALLGTWLVRRRLRPLAEVEATAAAIAAGDLSHRVPAYPVSTEVGSLAASLNTMLGQVEAAFVARQASEAAALESEQRMRQFVADASHELRTPLTSIRGYSELYRQGAIPDPAGVDRAMERIEGESVRMGGLVDDLLALARHDQQPVIERAPVDLAALARDAVDDARAAAPTRSVSLEAAEPAVVAGDDAALRQVVANLVANALQHTGGAVRVATTATAAQAMLSVTDDGPGLTPEQAARVFDRFYRADRARSREAGGSGLGLSIARAIAQEHGGDLTVESDPASGTRFTLTMPLGDTLPA